MKIMLNSPQAKFSISIVHLFKSRQVNRSWDKIYQLKPSNFPCLLVLKSHGIHQRFKETIWAWAKVICKLYQGHAPVPSAYWSAHHPRPSLRLTSRKHQKARNQERGINLRSKKQHRWKPRTRGDKTRQEIRGHLTRWNHERSGECGAEFWSWRIFFFFENKELTDWVCRRQRDPRFSEAVAAAEERNRDRRMWGGFCWKKKKMCWARRPTAHFTAYIVVKLGLANRCAVKRPTCNPSRKRGPSTIHSVFSIYYYSCQMKVFLIIILIITILLPKINIYIFVKTNGDLT